MDNQYVTGDGLSIYHFLNRKQIDNDLEKLSNENYDNYFEPMVVGILKDQDPLVAVKKYKDTDLLPKICEYILKNKYYYNIPFFTTVPINKYFDQQYADYVYRPSKTSENICMNGRFITMSTLPPALGSDAVSYTFIGVLESMYADLTSAAFYNSFISIIPLTMDDSSNSSISTLLDYFKTYKDLFPGNIPIEMESDNEEFTFIIVPLREYGSLSFSISISNDYNSCYYWDNVTKTFVSTYDNENAGNILEKFNNGTIQGFPVIYGTGSI